LAKETVLIVDDQRDSIESLTNQVLRPGGYEVSVARDGQTGLNKALSESPDLIVINLTVPRLSGLQVLQALRQANNETPVILTTFHGSEEAAVRAFQLGAQAYLIKPYQPEDMRQAIERGLVSRRLRSERDRLANSLSRTNRQMERRLKELSVLSSIGKAVTALLDEDRVLTRVVEAAVYITDAEEGFLLLVDQDSRELYMRAARGLGEKYARGFRLKVNDSLAGQVVQTGKPIMITSSQQSDRFKVKTGYLVRSLLHVPLKVGEAVVGVLSVDHMIEDRTFDNHDLYLLSTLADYAAIALENSRLHNELQQEIEKEHELTSASALARQGQPSPDTGQLRASLESQRAELQARLEAGKALLSELRERVSSFEVWLDGIDSQGRSLASVPIPSAEVSAASPASLRSDLLDIMDSMVDGVLAVDQTDQIVLANQVAEKTFGTTLVGRPVEQVCDDPRWSKTYRIIKAAAQLGTDTPGSELTSASTPLLVDQTLLRASFRAKPAAGQVPTGIVIVLRDITTEREAQRAKDSFIASVSQELRSPMTSIVGYSDLLLAQSVGQLNETQAKLLDRVRTNAERMGSLLNDLVGMTVIDIKQLEVKVDLTDLTAAIRQAASSLRTRLADKKQVIRLDIEPDLPYVRASNDAMFHVVTSLLENAHRSSREGSRIVLRAKRMHEGSEAYAVLSITDAGGGIAPEDYKKVFNRFYRADNPAVPGLGDPTNSLPIVKVLVEAQGGRVWFDSSPGEGSTFSLVLPVHPAAQA
jgi:PAS domain S-box-containing protein